MPYSSNWVPAEPFFTHDGFTILHTYRDNDINTNRQLFWYAIDGWDDGEWFDVRELPGFSEKSSEIDNPYDLSMHQYIITKAIDSGALQEVAIKLYQPYERT